MFGIKASPGLAVTPPSIKDVFEKVTIIRSSASSSFFFLITGLRFSGRADHRRKESLSGDLNPAGRPEGI